MKIAITGATGRIGGAITTEALRQGHSVIAIDRVAPAEPETRENLRFVQADMGDYEGLVEAFRGADALIHMAAIPSPMRDPDHIVHNNNVVGSYNALRAAVEVGIMRIVQASSVNAIGLSFSRAAHFDYLPLDEAHPNYSEEPYGLSKWICEQQADMFARRYEGIRISSMRFHLVTDERAKAVEIYGRASEDLAKHLWAYTLYDAASRACLLALEAPFTGHEVFYIVAPDTVMDVPSRELAARFFPDVPIRGDLDGNRSFFSSAKAERMLGWRHDPS
ncbi:NAD-dependent epimerase/dehydratase family protein [Kaistia dalseonensis]|uniref:UDP-glucose 4-epimerase n=1 Tax=Kaistia dalseonensis TaxID=410840 RepID=A0ABU0H965_9HYPH|nr:NAD-dependent epimerase/dehydratase family protein [Kaistia dalseonensis]MCX5495699.1 NAD-dependent epimerase/dehydratase family protein [Kaistia dalseonensis]MDQ0438295.1 UDP-glucose 4-epimerase [Kaistia dalseonensis]